MSGGGTMEVLTRLVSTGHSVLFAPSGLGRVSSEPVTRGGIFMPRTMIVCSACGEERERHARDLCARCVKRADARRSGIPERIARVEDRFWSHVVKGETCWLWTGAKKPTGYGNFYAEGKFTTAHRYAYRAG